MSQEPNVFTGDMLLVSQAVQQLQDTVMATNGRVGALTIAVNQYEACMSTPDNPKVVFHALSIWLSEKPHLLEVVDEVVKLQKALKKGNYLDRNELNAILTRFDNGK